MKKYALNLTMLFLPILLFGQGKYIDYIGLQSNLGFIIPHSEDIRSISNANPWALEVDLGKFQTNEKAYQNCACFPKSGFVLSYINFDNPSVIGKGITFMPYIEPVFATNKKLKFSLRAGAGIIYLTAPFDSVKNSQNLFYSTHLSAILSLNVRLNYSLNQKLNAVLSANYQHSSNGGLKQPNKGINFPMISLGFNYIFIPTEFELIEKKSFREIYTKRNYVIPSVFYTQLELTETGRIYPLYGIDIFYKHIVGRVSALNIGAEFVVDQSVRKRVEMDSAGIYGSDYKYAAGMVGHTFLMGKWWFSTDIGIYLYKRFQTKDNWYQRYSLSYTINNKWLVGLSLKSHRHVANFLDFRTGWKF